MARVIGGSRFNCMNWLKRGPILGAVVLAALLVIGLGGWALWRMRAQAAREIAGLEQKKHDGDNLQRRSPRPDQETAAASTPVARPLNFRKNHNRSPGSPSNRKFEARGART